MNRARASPEPSVRPPPRRRDDEPSLLDRAAELAAELRRHIGQAPESTPEGPAEAPSPEPERPHADSADDVLDPPDREGDRSGSP